MQSSGQSGVNKTVEKGEPKSTNEAQSSGVNSTVEKVTELQPSGVNKEAENATIPEETFSTLKDLTNETQPSGVNRANESGTETQSSGVNTEIRDGTTSGEPASILKDLTNKTQPSCVNGADENGTETQSSGVNSTVEKVTEIQPSGVNKVAEDATIQEETVSTLKDLTNKTQPSGVNGADENGTETQSSDVNSTVEKVTEIQPSGVNKAAKDATIPEETVSTLKDPSGVNRDNESGTETQSSGVNKEIMDDTISGEPASTLKDQTNKTQSSGVNTEIRADTTSGAEPASTMKDLTNETQSSGVNSTVENVTEIQPSGVNKAAENATVPEETVSTLNDLTNETQPSVVNGANENGTETQSSGVNSTVEDVTGIQPSGVNKMVENVTIPEETTSTLKDLSNQTQPSGVDRADESGTETQSSGVNTEIKDVTSPGETASILKNETQSSGVNENDNASKPKDMSNENQTLAYACCASKNSSILEMQASSLKDLPSESQATTVENMETIELCVTDLEDSTVSCVTTDCSLSAETVSTLQDTCNSTTAMTVSKEPTVSDVTTDCIMSEETVSMLKNISNEPAVSDVNTDCSMSEEKASMLKRMSTTPMSDFNEPAVSFITMEEIESTLNCIYDTPVADLDRCTTALCNMVVEAASSCIDMEHSTESSHEVESSLKDISASVDSQTSDNRNKKSLPTKEINQPPRKKIKLCKSVRIPVRDVLGGVHTRLCECNCTSKHNPLVLAVGAPNDCKLRTCLENHLKLAIKNGWRSSVNIQDPSSKLRQLVFHMGVLYGKLDLLEFMLKAQLGHSQFFANAARNSPLTTVFTNLHLFMPASSFDEKVAAFQQMLRLLVKYDSCALLIQDDVNGDTILHVCAKRIREITNEIKAKESFAPDFSQLQGLLDQRRLYERFCTEMIHTFKRLCAEGPLHQRQVLEFFDVRNKAGETMSEILQDEESMRKGCNVGGSQTSSPVPEQGNTEDLREQITVDKGSCDDNKAEGDSLQLTTVAETSSLLQTNDLSSICPTMQSVNVSTVVNLPETATVSTNCVSVQKPSGYPVSSTVSVSMLSPSQTGETGELPAPGHQTDLLTLQVNTTSPTGSETDSADTCAEPQLTSEQHINLIDLTTLQVNTASPLSSGSETRPADTGPQLSTSEQCIDLTTLQVNTASPSSSASETHPADTGPQLSTSEQCIDLTTLQVNTASPSSSGSETHPADTGPHLTSGQYIDLTTLQVNTVFPSPGRKTYPTDNHTFLCSPTCRVQHHELIQLLCVTPDHSSIITPTAEKESCSNFRTYLKESAWDLNTVVPDRLPKLCYSILHLACMLGKYKALEVLSEFGFHALIHTAITEETPLHMIVHLLQHQSLELGSLFLCDAVISIVRTLNRHSHAISLFSAKDYKGNTVLHSLAKMILPNKLVPETTAIVYLFRVFVHFLLKGQNASPSVTRQILSSALQDCNKAGECVEALLQRTDVGKQLWKCLTGLMEGSVHDTSNGEALNQREEDNAIEMEGQSTSSSTHCASVIRRDDFSQPSHTESEEPESLVDFIFSQVGRSFGSNNTRMLAEKYHKEYKARLQFLQGKVLSLKKEIKSAKKEEKCTKRLQKNEPILKSSIEWNKARMQSVIEERNKQRRQRSLNNQRLVLLEELKQDIEQWERQNTGAL